MEMRIMYIIIIIIIIITIMTMVGGSFGALQPEPMEIGEGLGVECSTGFRFSGGEGRFRLTSKERSISTAGWRLVVDTLYLYAFATGWTDNVF